MKALKALILIVVVLVVLVVGGVAAFLALVDPNDYKDEIAAKVREATGRELVLEGPLELGLYPKIRLQAGPLRLSNAAGFGDAPFFAAERIQVAVATLPLLSRRLEMDKVILHGLSVNLAKSADGTTNWADLAGEGAAEEEERGGDGLAAIVLGGVDIQNGRVHYSDATTGQEVTIADITAETGALTLGEPVAFSLALTATANQPTLDSDVKLTGTVSYNLDDEHYVIEPLALQTVMRGDHLSGGQATIDFGASIDINLDEETLTVSGLTLNGLGTEVSGAFAARDIEDDKPSAKGNLVVTGKDIAALFNAFELPVGQQLAGIKDRSFDFKTAFDADMDTGKVIVSELDGHLLGAMLGGNFTASGADTDQPSATGTLAMSGPDLPALLAIVGQLQGADAETLKTLRDALAKAGDKSFAINADLDANLADNGRAALPRLEATLLGNTIKGNLAATRADTEEPAVKGHLEAAGPDFPTLATVVAALQGTDAAALKSLGAALGGAADKSFKVAADVDADLAKGTADLPTLEATLLGNQVSGHVAARNLDKDEPAASGALTARGGDLPAMLAIASQFQADGAALRDMAKRLTKEKNKSFEVEVGFDADLGSGSIELPKLSADLLGLAVRGGLTGKNVDFEDGKGQLDGKLGVTSSDLGTLLRSAGQDDLAKSLRSLALDVGIKGSLSDLTFAPLSLVTQVKSPEVKQPVDLKVTAGAARANLDKDTLTVENLRVTGLGLNAKANLDASNLSEQPRFNGTLEVPAFNLRKLLASLNLDVPETSDPKALTSIALNSKLAGSTNAIKLDDLAIKLDDTNIKGNVDVKSFEGPNLSFGIGIDSLNVDRYMAPGEEGKAAAATPEAAAAGAASELPVETLRALKIKGELLVGKLVLSGATLSDVKFAIDANNGRIQLSPLGAKLYDGSYDGAIGLDATGAAAQLALKTALQGVKVEPLLKDTVQNDMLSGVVSFESMLRGVGGDPERLKKSLNGNGKFSTVDGVFRGVDAVGVLRAVEQMIECKCPVPLPEGGETRFSSLGGTLDVKKGVIHNQDLLLAGDGFKITGKGMLANLHDNTVKYDLELSVDEARKETTNANYN
ncbi:MAG: AsmA family protein, partial [Gammaproteobacteria bacterium]